MSQHSSALRCVLILRRAAIFKMKISIFVVLVLCHYALVYAAPSKNQTVEEPPQARNSTADEEEPPQQPDVETTPRPKPGPKTKREAEEIKERKRRDLTRRRRFFGIFGGGGGIGKILNQVTAGVTAGTHQIMTQVGGAVHQVGGAVGGALHQVGGTIHQISAEVNAKVQGAIKKVVQVAKATTTTIHVAHKRQTTKVQYKQSVHNLEADAVRNLQLIQSSKISNSFASKINIKTHVHKHVHAGIEEKLKLKEENAGFQKIGGVLRLIDKPLTGNTLSTVLTMKMAMLGIEKTTYYGFDVIADQKCSGKLGEKSALDKTMCSFKCMTQETCIGFVHDGQCQLVESCDKTISAKQSVFYKITSMISTKERARLLRSHVLFEGSCTGMSVITTMEKQSVSECLQACYLMDGCRAAQLDLTKQTCQLSRNDCTGFENKPTIRTFVNVRAVSYEFYVGKCNGGQSKGKKTFAECQKLCNSDTNCFGFAFKFGGTTECQIFTKEIDQNAVTNVAFWYTYKGTARKAEKSKTKCASGETLRWVRAHGAGLVMDRQHREIVSVNDYESCQSMAENSGSVFKALTFSRGVCTLYTQPVEKGELICDSNKDSILARQACMAKKKQRTQKECQCKVYGDPHYRTFDDLVVNFMGRCKYTVAESLIPNDPCHFKINVKNTDRGRSNILVTWARYMDIEFANDIIRFETGVSGRKIAVKIGRKDLDTRYWPDKTNQGSLCTAKHEGYYRIERKGRKEFLFEAPMCGIKANFKLHGFVTVTLDIPDRYRGGGKVGGVCGNCNGNKNDDLKTREGQKVKNNRDGHAKIGDSWIVHDQEAKGGCIVEKDFGCPKKMRKEVATNQYCGMIQDKKGKFKDCIKNKGVDAKQFFEACMTDVCAYKSTPDLAQSAACLSLAEFYEECLDKGIEVPNWRDTNFCPKTCPENMVYKARAEACPATCQDPRAPLDCDVPPAEGCVCQEGWVINGEDCMRQKDCGIRVVGDLTIVLDGTSHLDERNYTLAKNLVSNIVNSFYLDETTLQVQLVKFDESVTEVVQFGDYADVFALQRVIHRITYVGGTTQPSTVLERARKLIAERTKYRPKRLAPKILVIITNRDIMEDDSAQQQLTLMTLEDIKIIMVALVTVPIAQPVISYGQIRHLVLNSNWKTEITMKYVIHIIEKEAKCGKGQYYNGAECDDINECKMEICPEDTKCVDTKGSFRCYCDRGFIFDEKLGCLEINECYKRPCLEGSICKNVLGTYECTCRPGFIYDLEHGCVDDNECESHPGICLKGGTCHNTPGSYNCTCPSHQHYVQNEGCLDKDPCQPNPCKCGANCEPTGLTSHKCICASGFKYDDNSGCVAYDVCEDKPCTGDEVTCTSKGIGKFECVCKNGYEYMDGFGCVPIDFCADDPCVGDAECVSAEGAFSCICQEGMYYDASIGCTLPDDLEPIVQSVYIVDGSENMDLDTFLLARELLTKLTTDIAGTANTIQQGIVIAWTQTTVVLPMSERVVDHVIHEIREMEAPQTGAFDLVKAMKIVQTNMFKGKARVGVTRVLTIVVAGKVDKLSEVTTLAQEFLKAGVVIEVIGVGKAQITELEQVTKTTRSVTYVESAAELISIHTNILIDIQMSLACPEGYAKNGHQCQISPKSVVTCEMGGMLYKLGSIRTENCVTTKCTGAGPRIVRTECRRADGKCVPLGTRNFPCFNKGKFVPSCSCKKGGLVPNGGVTVQYIEMKVERRVEIISSEDKKKCVLPFVYLGHLFHECLPHSVDGKPWCSISVNYDADEEWGYCQPPVPEVTCSVNGKKYEAGQTWKRGCMHYKCTEKGTISTTARCETADGDCVDPGSSEFPCKVDGVLYEACSCTIGCDGKPKYYYTKINVIETEVIAGWNAKIQQYCYLDGKAYTLGQELMQACVKLRCNPSLGDEPFEVVKLGCEKADGTCTDVPAKNFPCKLYGTTYNSCECKVAQTGKSVVYSYKSEVGFYKSCQIQSRVTMQADCRSAVTGKTYKKGDKWTENCVELECIGQLEEPTAVVWRDCETDDPKKKCVPLGSRGFPCKIKGKRYEKCSCLSGEDNRVEYTVMTEPGDMKQVCVDPETNVKYEPGKTWEKDCYTFKCTDTGFEVVGQKCADLDNKCHEPGSSDVYACHLTEDMTSINCKCEIGELGVHSIATSEYVSMEAHAADVFEYQQAVESVQHVQYSVSSSYSYSSTTTSSSYSSVTVQGRKKKRHAKRRRRRHAGILMKKRSAKKTTEKRK